MIPLFGRVHLPVSAAVEEFPFAFDPLSRAALALINIRPASTRLRVDSDRNRLDIRFGAWHVTTTLTNVCAVELDGPYSPWEIIGPRVSVTDRGLILGTSTTVGVRLRFRHPVPGIEPLGLLRHPSLTVTVADPMELLALIRSRTGLPLDPPPRPRLGAGDEQPL